MYKKSQQSAGVKLALSYLLDLTEDLACTALYPSEVDDLENCVEFMTNNRKKTLNLSIYEMVFNALINIISQKKEYKDFNLMDKDMEDYFKRSEELQQYIKTVRRGFR